MYCFLNAGRIRDFNKVSGLFLCLLRRKGYKLSFRDFTKSILFDFLVSGLKCKEVLVGISAWSRLNYDCTNCLLCILFLNPYLYAELDAKGIFLCLDH